jgi:hypothetical protein
VSINTPLWCFPTAGIGAILVTMSTANQKFVGFADPVSWYKTVRKSAPFCIILGCARVEYILFQ